MAAYKKARTWDGTTPSSRSRRRVPPGIYESAYAEVYRGVMNESARGYRRVVCESGGGYRRTEYQMLLLNIVALEVEVEPGLVLVHELEHDMEVEPQVEVEAGGEGTFP